MPISVFFITNVKFDLMNFDMIEVLITCFSLSPQSMDLLVFPAQCERFLPAHPRPDQEWAYCGCQVRNSKSPPPLLSVPFLTHSIAGPIMMFLKCSAEALLDQVKLWIWQKGWIKIVPHECVCGCMFSWGDTQPSPSLTPLKASAHIKPETMA